MGVENESSVITTSKPTVDSAEETNVAGLLKKNSYFLDEYMAIDDLKSNGDISIITQSITDHLNKITTKLEDSPEEMQIDDLDRQNNAFFMHSDEAAKNGIEKHVQNFSQCCKNLCEIFHEIHKLKINKSEESEQELLNLKRSGLVAFASFKNYFEVTRLYVQEHHEHTAELQEHGKSKYVLLNSVLYEMTEVVHEIKMCDRYTRYDNRLKMIPFEEFKALQEQEGNKIIDSSSHAVILKRMNDELQRRKDQNDTLTRLLKEKESKTNDIRRINEFSRGLAPKLANIIEVAKPLQNYLNKPCDYERSQFRISKLLPENLYYLFIQAKAHREAYDPKLEIQIMGDLSKAEEFEWKRTPKIVRNSRSVVVMAPDAKELTDTMDNVLEQHPLSLKLTLNADQEVSISLEFLMCIQLNIVTVKSDLISANVVDLDTENFREILNSESILENIYLLDKGKICPNKAAELLLKKHKKGTFEEHIEDLGYPYLWSQYICGLCPSVTEKTHSEHRYLRKTLEVISERLEARAGLVKELVSIEKREIQTNITPKPTQLNSILTKNLSWKRLTPEDIEVINLKTKENDNTIIEYCDKFVFASTLLNSCKDVNKLMYIYFFLAGDYPATAPYCMISNEDIITKRYVESNYTMNLQNYLNNQFLLSKIPLSEQLFYAMHSTHIFNAMNSDQSELSFKRNYRGPARNIPNAYNDKLKYFYHGQMDEDEIQ